MFLEAAFPSGSCNREPSLQKQNKYLSSVSNCAVKIRERKTRDRKIEENRPAPRSEASSSSKVNHHGSLRTDTSLQSLESTTSGKPAAASRRCTSITISKIPFRSKILDRSSSIAFLARSLVRRPAQRNKRKPKFQPSIREVEDY